MLTLGMCGDSASVSKVGRPKVGRRLLLAVVAVLGCAEMPDQSPPTRGAASAAGTSDVTRTRSALSGARLKPYWLTASDGSRQFMNLWRDTQLNVDCNFQQDPDGQWRCLPGALNAGASLFSDSGCLAPLAYVECPPHGEPPSYVTVSTTSGTGCGAVTTSTFHSRGAPYTGAVFDGSPASCSATDSTLFSQFWLVYDIGPAVDVTTFEAASYGYQ